MRIRRGGHSMFHIITDRGLQLLIDPYISGNASAIPEFKNPENLRRLDALLVSHAHRDHANGVADVVKVNPDVAVVCNQELASLLEAVGARNVVRLDIGGTFTLKAVACTMVSAAHHASFGDKRVFAGIAGGFIIRLESGFKIYYAGDTGLSADMKLVIGDYFKPDLAILPVGGTYTMDPEQAAYAVGEMIKARQVIPCHYHPRPEDAPDPAAMAHHFQVSVTARNSVGKGQELKALMQKRYPQIETIVLEVGQSCEIKS